MASSYAWKVEISNTDETSENLQDWRLHVHAMCIVGWN